MNELMNELINELINEWMNELMNEWMDVGVDALNSIYVRLSSSACILFNSSIPKSQ